MGIVRAHVTEEMAVCYFDETYLMFERLMAVAVQTFHILALYNIYTYHYHQISLSKFVLACLIDPSYKPTY